MRPARILLKAILFILVLFPVVPLQAEEIRIGGTGGALGVMAKLAAEYQQSHPAVAFTIMPSLGSSGGLKALSAGALDLAVSARQPGINEPGMVSRELGRTPFVFATAKSTPLSSVTLRTVEDIYGGRTSKWPDGQYCRVVLRPVTENDTALLKSMSPEMERAVSAAVLRQGMIIGVTDQENAEAIQTVPGAIGTVTLGQLITEHRTLKALALNGIKPGLDTLANGSYPYSKSYYLVTKPQPGKALSSFLDFIRSSRGRKILTGSGYQTVNR
jgi:phosphate transport system substrate-binding protein